MYCREDTPDEAVILGHIPDRAGQAAERVAELRRVQRVRRADRERVASVVSASGALDALRLVRLTDLIDGAVVPGLLDEVEEIFMTGPAPISHAFWKRVGFGPDDVAAEDEAELVGAGERVPGWQLEQALGRHPRDGCTGPLRLRVRVATASPPLAELGQAAIAAVAG
jgi:hypothetical protein